MRLTRRATTFASQPQIVHQQARPDTQVYSFSANIQLKIMRALSRLRARIREASFKLPTTETAAGDVAAAACNLVLGGNAERSFFSSFDDRTAARRSESRSVPRISMFGMMQWPPMIPGVYFTGGRKAISS